MADIDILRVLRDEIREIINRYETYYIPKTRFISVTKKAVGPHQPELSAYKRFGIAAYKKALEFTEDAIQLEENK